MSANMQTVQINVSLAAYGMEHEPNMPLRLKRKRRTVPCCTFVFVQSDFIVPAAGYIQPAAFFQKSVKPLLLHPQIAWINNKIPMAVQHLTYSLRMLRKC